MDEHARVLVTVREIGLALQPIRGSSSREGSPHTARYALDAFPTGSSP